MMQEANQFGGRPRLCVVGSANTDLIIKTSRLPRPGETVCDGKFSTAAGGKGANQAVAAQRLGAAVSLVATLGQDAFGDQALQQYEAEGIDVRYISRHASAATGLAFILVDDKGENSIVVAAGANAQTTPAWVNHSAAAIRTAGALVLQLEIPLAAVGRAVEIAAENDVPVILNPAPAAALPDSLLAKVDTLTPNEWEAQALTGLAVKDDASAHRAAQKLLAKGVRTVIITLGSRGAWLETHNQAERVPAFFVQAQDTTAAGDVFTAALAVALTEKQALHQAVRFAGAAAAISVTRLGAQPSAPKRNEVEAWLAERKER